MRTIKLTIEYDGTHFNGWQVQPSHKRTIQGEIEKALKVLFQKHLRLIGSGRTDSGVHATGQVAHFKTASRMTTDEILNALNANLPDDIAILKVEEAAEKFHAQFRAKRKTYRYSVLNRQARCAQQKHFFLHLPQKLNLALMRSEGRELVGRKDFRSFMTTDPAPRHMRKEKETIRTIYRLDIKKRGDCLYIDIEANGFLYKMVRTIVGTLLAVGTGKLPKGSIRTILKQKSRLSAGATAPAKGLTLIEVKY